MPQLLEHQTEFAGYHIEELIARGGMGEVYRAENPRVGRKVALKLLPRELAEDERFRERFVRESRVAAGLDHGHVIPIYDAGEADGIPYIAMRYVEGEDLKALLETEGPLPADRAVAIVSQVAGALDCAHKQGLVHRDVKPANILLDAKMANGTGDHVYLTDFGVAKHRLSSSGLTSTGQFVGTIDYIAPEQLDGGTVIGPSADVYSLGCVLFEVLTGESPFERESNAAMIYAHLIEPPPSVLERRPDLPRALDDVLQRALSKKPEERFANCVELAEAAEAAIHGVPTPVASTLAGAPETLPAAAAPATLAGAPATLPAEAPPTVAAPAAPVPEPPAARVPVTAGAPAPPLEDFSPPVVAPPRKRGRLVSTKLAVILGSLVLAGAAAAAVGVVNSGGDVPILGTEEPDSTPEPIYDEPTLPLGEGRPTGPQPNLTSEQIAENRDRARQIRVRTARQRAARIRRQQAAAQQSARQRAQALAAQQRRQQQVNARARAEALAEQARRQAQQSAEARARELQRQQEQQMQDARRRAGG